MGSDIMSKRNGKVHAEPAPEIEAPSHPELAERGGWPAQPAADLATTNDAPAAPAEPPAAPADGG